MNNEAEKQSGDEENQENENNVEKEISPEEKIKELRR